MSLLGIIEKFDFGEEYKVEQLSAGFGGSYEDFLNTFDIAERVVTFDEMQFINCKHYEEAMITPATAGIETIQPEQLVSVDVRIENNKCYATAVRPAPVPGGGALTKLGIK